MPSVTIKDVAKAAGVSIKTVSRVINENSEVADETRSRVERVIQLLGYQPNLLARSLARGRSNTVGVVIPLAAQYIFSHLFFTEVLKGIAEVLGENSLDLLLHLAKTDSPYIQLYQKQRVDGLILMSVPIDDPNLDGLVEGDVPCVFTCQISEEDNPTHWVDVDFAGGVEQSVEHLVHLGHTRIGLLAGPSNLVSVRLRSQGYKRALGRLGVGVSERLTVYGEFTFNAGRRLAKELMNLEQPPTAIICGDDMMALGAIQGLQDSGYQIPEDVSIVGFDDVVLAEFAVPPLTTVRQDAHSKGRIAADALVELVSNSANSRRTQILLDTELVVRESTGPAKDV